MNFKLRQIGSIVFVAVLLVGSLGFPGCMNAKKENERYLENIEPLLEQTEEEMEKARDIMKSGMITEYDQEVSEMDGDISSAKSTCESAKEVVEKNYDKFEKESCPKEAESIKEKIEKYFKDSKKYLTRIKAITKYYEKWSPILAKNDDAFETMDTQIETTQTHAREIPIRTAYKSNLVETINGARGIEAPESVKDIHQHAISSFEEDLAYIEKVISAASREAEDEYNRTIGEWNGKISEQNARLKSDYKNLAENSDEAEMVKNLKKLYVEIEDDIQALKKKLKI